MGLIENPKTYTGRDLETIFFRPMFTGANAEELGIRVLYNMPLPTTVQVWSGGQNILQEFSCGWSGEPCTKKKQKTPRRSEKIHRELYEKSLMTWITKMVESLT